MTIKKIGAALVGTLGVAGVSSCLIIYKNRIKFLESKNVKFKKYYNLLDEWMKQSRKGRKIENYLMAQDLKKIAIYGLGEIGQRLYEELCDSDITIVKGIDQFDNSEIDIDIIEPCDVRQIVGLADAIIVTAVADYDEICKNLSDVDIKIISLEEIVFNL